MNEETQTPAVTEEDLNEWYSLTQQLKKVKAQELALRNQIFGMAFPEPVEGTNDYALEYGYQLKGKYNLLRSVDEGAFSALKVPLLKAGVAIDELIKFKPSLSISEYRKLTEEQRLLVDQFLIIRPGSPSLEIVKPKKVKK